MIAVAEDSFKETNFECYLYKFVNMITLDIFLMRDFSEYQ